MIRGQEEVAHQLMLFGKITTCIYITLVSFSECFILYDGPNLLREMKIGWSVWHGWGILMRSRGIIVRLRLRESRGWTRLAAWSHPWVGWLQQLNVICGTSEVEFSSLPYMRPGVHQGKARDVDWWISTQGGCTIGGWNRWRVVDMSWAAVECWRQRISELAGEYYNQDWALVEWSYNIVCCTKIYERNKCTTKNVMAPVDLKWGSAEGVPVTHRLIMLKIERRPRECITVHPRTSTDLA